MAQTLALLELYPTTPVCFKWLMKTLACFYCNPQDPMQLDSMLFQRHFALSFSVHANVLLLNCHINKWTEGGLVGSAFLKPQRI